MTGWQGHDETREDTRPIWVPPPRDTPADTPEPDQPSDATRDSAPPVRPEAPRRRRRWGLALLVAFLVLGLAAAAALAAYLWRTTLAWQEEAARVAQVAADLREEHDTLAAELDQAERDRAATEQQLFEAQTRITELAEEKALTADEREVARQLVAAAAAVATQLEVCVRGQDQLITALGDIESYDPESVVQYAESVRAACNQALEGNEEIQRIVGE